MRRILRFGLSSNWKTVQTRLTAELAIKPNLKRAYATDDSTPLPITKAEEIKSTTNDASPTAQSAQTIVLQEQTLKISTVSSDSHKAADGSVSGQSIIDAAQSSLAQGEQTPDGGPSLTGTEGADGLSAQEELLQVPALSAEDSALVLSRPDDKLNGGLAAGVEVGKYIAMDAEMVGVGPDGIVSALARVSLVDFHGRQVYDSFVKPLRPVTDWRTMISGITKEHMLIARDFYKVQREVAKLLQGRILIGHSVRNDLRALWLRHPPPDIRDTAHHVFPGIEGPDENLSAPLRVLAQTLLSLKIQQGMHSSMHDARVAMMLFRQYKPDFDAAHEFRYQKPLNEKRGASYKKESIAEALGEYINEKETVGEFVSDES